MTDNHKNELKAQMRAWLIDLGFGVEEQLHPGTVWVLVGKNMHNLGVAVAEEVGNSDRIVLQYAFTLAPHHQAQLNNLSTEERDAFLWELRFRLLVFDVDFAGVDLPLESVNFTRTVYVEGLTKNLFADKISQLHKAYTAASWMFLQLASKDNGPLTITH